VGDVVYEGIVEILKAPDGDRFIVIGEHAPENFVLNRSGIVESTSLTLRSVLRSISSRGLRQLTLESLVPLACFPEG
jgi:hypothetical protein